MTTTPPPEGTTEPRECTFRITLPVHLFDDERVTAIFEDTIERIEALEPDRTWDTFLSASVEGHDRPSPLAPAAEDDAVRAPAVPDSAGLRERLPFTIDDGNPRVLTSKSGGCRPAKETETAMWDLLAVVGQGEQGCNCGFGGQHDPANPRCRVNDPSEAWLRSGEQGGDRG